MRLPPISPLFPYTTLFRSGKSGRAHAARVGVAEGKQSHRGRGTFRARDRKSTRLNSIHITTSYAVFCLKKKTAQLSHLLTAWISEFRTAESLSAAPFSQPQ